jgi:hypothetical protein
MSERLFVAGGAQMLSAGFDGASLLYAWRSMGLFDQHDTSLEPARNRGTRSLAQRLDTLIYRVWVPHQAEGMRRSLAHGGRDYTVFFLPTGRLVEASTAACIMPSSAVDRMSASAREVARPALRF